MGGGSWTTDSFRSYSTSKGYKTSSAGVILDNFSAQDNFKARRLDSALDPINVMRESLDTEEHPNTIPIIFGLDVTGSMGAAGAEVAKKLNVIITDLYERYKDVQIMVMGIGDLYCDSAPIQISQFESDIRIAEQLDKIYFEFGGGGNGYESYSAAWYMGLHHTKLDCWKRGKKGIIITTGDEPLNPYLPKDGHYSGLRHATGDNLEADVDTKDLYKDASEKFDIYHIAVDDHSTAYHRYANMIKNSFGQILPEGHLKVSNLDSLAKTVVECIDDALGNNNMTNNSNDGISW